MKWSHKGYNSVIFYRSVIIGCISYYLMRKHKIDALSETYEISIKRNLLEAISMLLNFSSMKIIPLSVFTVFFNSKAIFIYFFYSIFKKQIPPLKNILMLILSFIGMFLLTKSDSQIKQEDKTLDSQYVIGVWLVIGGTSFVAVADIYMNTISINN